MRSIVLVAITALASVAGAQQRRMTHGGSPSVSPDGRWIAFGSDRDGQRYVYVIGADGSHERRLDATAGGAKPRWSADGSQVIYSVFAHDPSTLFSLDVHGGTPHPIATVPGRSPELVDDNAIMFTAGVWNHTALAVADLQGRLTRTIADSGASIWNAVASPDGRRIAYTQAPAGKGLQVAMMNVDGTARQTLTSFSPDEGGPQSPVWSPDGRRLAFQANGRAPQDTTRRLSYIYMIDLATRRVTKLSMQDGPRRRAGSLTAGRSLFRATGPAVSRCGS